MDEIKDMNNQNNPNPNAQNGGQGGGRRRRRRKRGGHHGQNGQNPQNSQNVQNAQNTQTEQAVKGVKTQPQPAQPNQNNGNNGGQGGGKKQKNKNAQKQNQQGGGNKSAQQKQAPEKKDENRKDTYVYTLDGNLYINLTNKCSNGCDFCVRNERTSYYGNYLWLRHGDPTVEKVIAAANGMGDLTRFKEAVFCGFGEPTYKVAEMVALCDFFHDKGLSTRLNTNGQGNLINKRDIVPDLKGKIDLVNVSLNASCVEKYQPICRSQFGESGFNGMIEFAKLCRRNGINCRFSIVDCIGEDEVEACKRLAQSVNIPLYIRDYITDS
ncbi:MAG: TatD family nuclease-associated radical SAM protein [Clostridia bacterium]|nr:TatD family nuclease-associated radical SAM protein [Clostridia bacterium]